MDDLSWINYALAWHEAKDLWVYLVAFAFGVGTGWGLRKGLK